MPLSRPGKPVAVTSTSAGTLKVPDQDDYGWAVVANVTPWLATVMTGNGAETLQPFSQDMFELPTGATALAYTMSVPPSGTATAPTNQPLYLQVDWYVAAAGPPDGVWPLSLAAQALVSVAGAIQTFTAAQLVYNGTLAAIPASVPSAPLSAGARSLMFVFSGVTGSSQLTLKGSTSGAVFVSGVQSLAGSAIFVAFDSTVDATLATSGVSGPGSVIIYALGEAVATSAEYPLTFNAGPGNQMLIAGLVQPGAIAAGLAFPVQLTAQESLIIAGGIASGQPVADPPVLVGGSDGTDVRTLSTDTSGRLLVGQIPGLKTASFDVSVAAGATSSVVAAVGGKVVTVYGYDFTIAPVTAATTGVYAVLLEDTTPSVVVTRRRILWGTDVSLGSLSPSPFWIPGGLALGTGLGLQFASAAGSAGNVAINGVVYYTQA